MNQEEQDKKMSQLIARCWADEAFKHQLLNDTAATLKAEGIEVPEGLSFKAVENTEKVFHLVIPDRPTDLSDDELDEIAGGGKHWGRFVAFLRDNAHLMPYGGYSGPRRL